MLNLCSLLDSHNTTMIIDRNIKENAIVKIGGPGDAMGGTIYEYVDVTVLCRNCNHDHLYENHPHIYQNLCMEDGKCKCKNGTGKKIDRVPLNAWFGGMERQFEWISYDGQYFEKPGMSTDPQKGYDAVPSSPPNRIVTGFKQMFLVLFFFGFFIFSSFLTVTFVILSISNPVNLIVVLVCSLLSWGLADGIWDRYFAPRLLVYRENRLNSKYKVMKSQSSSPVL